MRSTALNGCTLTNPLHNESAQPCLPQCMNLLHHHPRLYQSPTRAPAASASKPKPAKGCMRIPPHQDPVKPGRQWPMPPISEGYDNVGDGAPWRSIAVGQYHRMSWPLWGRGVTDLRPKTGSGMVAGRLLRHALEAAIRMIREVPCEQKIGMCRCPHERFSSIKKRAQSGNRG